MYAGADVAHVKSALVRLGEGQMIEEAVEAKIPDLLGREDDERSSDGQRSYRKGHRRRRRKSSEGEIRYPSPRVRDVDDDELAALRPALENLVAEVLARGLSTGDIEAPRFE